MMKSTSSISYYLFLDDIRNPSQVTWERLPVTDWVIARNYQQFISIIKMNGLPKFISFDHDLADEHYDSSKKEYREKTGYDCAQWLVNYCLDNDVDPCEYVVHSMNPVGKKNIEFFLSQFSRFKASQ